MSTPETGDAAVAKSFVDDAKALLEAATAEEEQLDLLGPPTSEEMIEAREELGPNAGRLAVLRHAREMRKRGRPPGSRNRRTDDFARYILSFGPDPAVTLMQIQATPEEVMMEASRRRVTKVISGGKGAGDKVIEIEEETLTFEGARSMRIRCAEALMPFVHSKQPVAVDMSIHSDFNLIEEIIEGGALGVQDGEFLEIQGPAGPGGEGGE